MDLIVIWMKNKDLDRHVADVFLKCNIIFNILSMEFKKGHEKKVKIRN